MGVAALDLVGRRGRAPQEPVWKDEIGHGSLSDRQLAAVKAVSTRYLPHELDHLEAIVVFVQAFAVRDLALTVGVLHVAAVLADTVVANGAMTQITRTLGAAKRAGYPWVPA